MSLSAPVSALVDGQQVNARLQHNNGSPRLMQQGRQIAEGWPEIADGFTEWTVGGVLVGPRSNARPIAERLRSATHNGEHLASDTLAVHRWSLVAMVMADSDTPVLGWPILLWPKLNTTRGELTGYDFDGEFLTVKVTTVLRKCCGG